jgi:cell division protein FtsX
MRHLFSNRLKSIIVQKNIIWIAILDSVYMIIIIIILLSVIDEWTISICDMKKMFEDEVKDNPWVFMV